MIYSGLLSAKSPADHDRVKDFATAMLKLGLLDRPVISNGQQYGDNYSSIDGQYQPYVRTSESSEAPARLEIWGQKWEAPIKARQNFGFQFLYELLRGFFLLVIIFFVFMMFQS